jgi:hypothetical protein
VCCVEGVRECLRCVVCCCCVFAVVVSVVVCVRVFTCLWAWLGLDVHLSIVQSTCTDSCLLLRVDEQAIILN